MITIQQTQHKVCDGHACAFVGLGTKQGGIRQIDAVQKQRAAENCNY